MHTYEKFNVRLFPIFLLIISIAFLFSKMYIEAGISGTIGALFSISYKGYNIDTQNMRIRHFDRFLWFNFGTWRPITNPLYVTVVRIKLSGRRDSPLPMIMPGNSTPSSSYKINLVVDSKERYISLTYGSRIKMLEEGLKIAQILNIKMLDHTTSEKKWMS